MAEENVRLIRREVRSPRSAAVAGIAFSILMITGLEERDARKKGIDPGGDIMVHGQAKDWEWLSPITQYFNWTDGCVALTNSDMDKVWNAVDPGTPIEIIP